MRPADGTDRHDPLDDVLRQAFKQVDPPPGFAERVVRRASQDPIRIGSGSSAWLRWATAAALVVSASAVSGGLWHRAAERRRLEGEAARRQVLLSLQIAGNKLHAVQLKINRQEESGQ